MKFFKKKYVLSLLGILLISSLFLFLTKQEKIKEEKAVILANKAIQLYKTKHNYIGAEKLFQQSLLLDDKNIITHINYSQMYCSKGDVDKAFNILNKAQKYTHFTSVHFFLLGLYADILGDKLEAIKYYNKSIETADDNDTNKILTLYFINPNRSLDEFKTIKPTKMNQFLIDDINKNSMKHYIQTFLQDACGQN